jgi:hypothetical protein
MRKFAAIIALASAASAFAGVATKAQQANPVGLPPGTQAWDLVITVSGGDDWTSASTNSVSGGGWTFTDPNPAVNFYLPGFNDADTWCTAPDASTLGFAEALSVTANSLKATWFDTGNKGDGTYTIARIVMNPGAGAVEINGAHTAKLSGGTLIPYSVIIPEPSTIGLLVLGGLAGLIRRR